MAGLDFNATSGWVWALPASALEGASEVVLWIGVWYLCVYECVCVVSVCMSVCFCVCACLGLSYNCIFSMSIDTLKQNAASVWVWACPHSTLEVRLTSSYGYVRVSVCVC